jgi:hypothetical protein
VVAERSETKGCRVFLARRDFLDDFDGYGDGVAAPTVAGRIARVLLPGSLSRPFSRFAFRQNSSLRRPSPDLETELRALSSSNTIPFPPIYHPSTILETLGRRETHVMHEGTTTRQLQLNPFRLPSDRFRPRNVCRFHLAHTF